MELDYLAGELAEPDFETIRRMVYDQTGIRLTGQKKAMIQSRLMKRLKQIRCQSFNRYVKLVRLDPRERNLMFNLLTTNVTKFFREDNHFQFLTTCFLPEFLALNAQTRPLKVWSAGCSSGQEPYSLGIVLNEFFNNSSGADFRITATDINTDVLEKARDGIYLWDEVNDIPYTLLKKYFKLGTGQNARKFRVKDEIRKRISFKYLNLVEPGASFSVDGMFDIIFCRNVFIYFDQETKARAIKKFYNKLHPGGCLFLGHSESLDVKNANMGNWSIMQHTVYRKEL